MPWWLSACQQKNSDKRCTVHTQRNGGRGRHGVVVEKAKQRRIVPTCIISPHPQGSFPFVCTCRIHAHETLEAFTEENPFDSTCLDADLEAGNGWGCACCASGRG